MAINSKLTKRFSARLEVLGENANIIKKGLEEKMKKESRKTYNNAIEAALIEYFSKPKAKTNEQ